MQRVAGPLTMAGAVVLVSAAVGGPCHHQQRWPSEKVAVENDGENLEQTFNTESSPNVEYGKMRSELNEYALGVDLRGIHSAFYFIRAKPGMPRARRRV